MTALRLLLLAAGISGLLYVAAWAVVQVFAEMWAGYDAGAKLATRPGQQYADLDAIPEPTWDQPADLPRQRLHLVRPDELEWARIRRAVRVPEQRQASE